MAGFGGFGTTQQPSTGGFSFGSGAATAANKPIGIGTTQANTTTTTSSSGGLLSGLLNSGTTTASTGFSLGGTTTSAAGGFSLGGTTTSTGGGFSLGGTATSKGGGFSLSGAATTSAPGGLSFGTPAASSSAATSSAAPSTGFGFGSTASTAASSTGLTLGATSTAANTGFSLTGGLGGGGGLGTGLGGGLGGQGTATTTSASRGLGGVNPASTSSAASASSKPTDPKASSKEAQVEDVIAQTVDQFQKYVKQQKVVRESIARVSCTSLYKVQEEVSTLQQALSLVSHGLQRNASVISKLKLQAAQELKYAEISQRTKDTPPGLQYENTAPTEYFQHMVVAFEQQMVTYRQQIEQMETYLSSLHHNAMLTPHELSTLLSKLLSSFVSLAAQLQSIHEQVNAQKEHYLNYRKVFHGDTTDVFEQQCGGDRKARSAASAIPAAVPVGPTPFHATNSPAALAMAAMTTRHRPAAGSAPTAPTGQSGLGFGTGAGIFGSPAQNPAAPKPLAFGSGGGSTFGSGGGSTFGTGSTFGSGSAFGSGNTTSSFGQPTATVRPLGADPQPAAQTSFQLQSPPLGNKRNKKS